MTETGPDGQNRIGPTPTGRDRRTLTGRGHRLKTKVIIGRAGFNEAILAEIRRNLRNTDLLKVRIDADSPTEADGLAEDLASRVPCHLIQRVGRVALLYRPLPQHTKPIRDKGTTG